MSVTEIHDILSHMANLVIVPYSFKDIHDDLGLKVNQGSKA